MTLAGLLLLTAVGGFFAAAGLAPLGRRLTYGISLVSSALLFAVAVAAMTGVVVAGPSWSGPLGNPESLALDGLSAFFALSAAGVWMATSAYSIYYDDRSSPLLSASYAVTLGAIALLVSSTDFVLFLVGWEVMTISAYGMILEASGRRGRIFSAAFVFLAFGEASTLFVLLAVGGLRVASGTFAEVVSPANGTMGSLIFLAALIGFGLKMGVAPFHMSEWLPIAHSSAPSNASAVLSSTLTLAGVYGLFRVVSLLPSQPVWWGAVTLAIGAVSALLGALFASVSEHTKGLPAYSTIENNGLILVALGVALIARSEGLLVLFAFALFAAFYQALAHALAKTALFLSAGYVEHARGTFDLNSVRTGPKSEDRAALAGTLAATLSLAAAPPLAGFVSEWMVLEALFQSYRFSPASVQFLGLLAGAAVALAAGLIIVAMVKFMGFAYLWQPAAGGQPHRPPGLGLVIGTVGAVVVGLGVFSPWVLSFLTPTIHSFAGVGLTAPISGLLSVPQGWSIVSGAPFGIVSPPVIPFALAAGAAVAAGYLALGRRPGRRRVAPWMAGSPSGVSGEVYSSFSYSTGLRIMLGSILRTREVRATAGPVTMAGLQTPEAYNVELEVLDVFKLFYDALVRFGFAISDTLKVSIMPGRLGRYLLYILVTTFVVISYLAIVA